MENRFGLKDLFLFLMVGLLIVLVLLGWKQYDRQWEIIQQIKSTVDNQTNDLARIRRTIENPRFATTGPSSGMDSNLDVDIRARKIHENADYAPGDAVVDVFTQIPDKLTPLISTDLYSQQVQGYVLDTLIDRDPVTLDWIPRLARKWKVSADGLKVDFTLRKGVTFSDGEPLTVDDVLFTIDLTRNEKVEAPRPRAYLDKLDKVVKLNDDEVEFVFTEPYFMALETAGSTQVLSKKFYSQFTPKQINESTGFLIGSGPYKLPDPKSWKPEPGKPVELVRNERYWGEQPGPNRLVWRLISEPAACMTALRNGEIDVYYQPSPEQFDTMTKDVNLLARCNLHEMETSISGYYYIGWNEKRGGKPTPFADPRVRKAMTMLIDRKRLIHDVMHDHAVETTGPFSRLSKQYDPTVQPWPYDPTGAQKLLAEAGFHRENDQLIGPDGKPFGFEFLYNPERPVSKQVSTYLKDVMAQAGIDVHLIAGEWSTFLQKTKERDYDSIFMGWGGAVEDDPNQIFTTKAIEGVGDNFVQYSNPKFDAVVEKARRTVNEKARNLLWHEAHRILHEDQPYTFMFADKELDAVDKRFEGVEETKLGFMTLKNEWYVPVKLQKYKN